VRASLLKHIVTTNGVYVCQLFLRAVSAVYEPATSSNNL